MPRFFSLLPRVLTDFHILEFSPKQGNSTVADVTFRLRFETLIWHRQRIKKELPSFPLMNMFVPNDILIGLYNFSLSLISVKEIEPKNTVADVT